jgi:preprotein translocase subunit SecY
MAATAQAVSGASGGGRLLELRQRLWFLLIGIVVFRICTHIPVPGIDPQALALLFKEQQGSILDMFNMFSGGALERFSVVALGVMPYISASIITQLLSEIYPALKELKKEGEAGRRKIAQYTRYGTVGLATFQALGVALALEAQQGGGIPLVIDPGYAFRLTCVTSLVTGTLFLMWLGEQITERGIGNGMSMIIFAGIVAGLPKAVGGSLTLVGQGELSELTLLLVVALVVVVTALVVFVERAQRRITVQYARQQRGRRVMGGQTSHLPLKLNMAGVVPPIFASSLILFPTTIASWVETIPGFEWVGDFTSVLRPGQPIYVALYAGAIVFFCFFYTALMVNPRETADNLKKSGAFIPGIRPGRHTEAYIDSVLSRLTLAGAIYIAVVCLLPEFMILEFNVPFYFGGTSLLIIVVVVMDLMSQVQAHVVSHQYEGLLKKSNLKGLPAVR